MSKNKTPEAIVKQHAKKVAAKKEAEHRNKNGALVMLLDKPDGQYTHEITCVEPGCGKTRRVKPQDAWQVKRCVECRDAQKKAGLKAFVAKVKDPVVNAKKIIDTRLKRLDAWVERMDREMHEAFARRDAFYKKLALEPKYHRVWP